MSAAESCGKQSYPASGGGSSSTNSTASAGFSATAIIDQR